MKVIIDRFEGKYAVCEKEDRVMINIHISKIPFTSKEGDVLDMQDDKILMDNKSTDDRKKHIKDITKDLWEN